MIAIMVTLVVCINLFFVPVIAVWCYYWNEKCGIVIKLSLKLLLQYAIFVVCNVPLTKAGIFLVRMLLHKDISIDSGYYTLIAMVSAVALPCLIKKIRIFYNNRTVIKRNIRYFFTKRSMKYNQKLMTSSLLVLVIVIAYEIRGPLEIYVGNVNEFLFTIENFILPLLMMAVGTLIIVSCLLAFLPDGPFYIVSILLLWFGISSWVQDLFLNTKLFEANGGPMDWRNLRFLSSINLLVWIIFLFGILMLAIYLKERWFSFSKFITKSLCAVQSIAVVFLLVTMPEPKPVTQQLSGENQMTLGSDENIIVFVMDTVGIDVLLETIEEYPETAEIMKDFVLYNNACSDYFPTFPTFTHFMTGNKVDFQENALDWLETSWSSDRCSQFFQNIKDAGYQCHLYTEPSYIGYIFGDINNLLGKFDNVARTHTRINKQILLQKLLKLSTYRCMPYALKPPFEVLTSDFNDIVTVMDFPAPSYTNVAFYNRLVSQRLSVSPEVKKCFYVNHLEGVHKPWHTSADASFFEEETSEVETMRGLFTILQEYFNQMKELDVYNDATIIVMADHSSGQDSLSPMFYLKQKNETHDCTEVNSAPVSYQDFQATILELIGHNNGDFGASFFDWKPGEERCRTVYIIFHDENAPLVKGSDWNRYLGYTYYKDAEELHTHMIEDGPDFIETALER